MTAVKLGHYTYVLGKLNHLQFVWEINQLKVRDEGKEILQLKIME